MKKTCLALLAIVLIGSARADQTPALTIYLDPNSTPGDYFGTFSLDSTTAGLSASATYAVPDASGDQIGINFYTIFESQSDFYVYGVMDFDGDAISYAGGPGGTFTPGVANNGIFSRGKGTALLGPVDVNVSWLLPMPWNGSDVDWQGTWDLTWTVNGQTPQPILQTNLDSPASDSGATAVGDSGSTLLMLGMGSLMLCAGAAVRRMRAAKASGPFDGAFLAATAPERR
jgi:hypothetical protein